MVHNQILMTGIDFELLIERRHGQMIHLVFIGQILQFTITALRTKHAIMSSFRKKKLQNGPPCVDDGPRCT